MRYAAVLTLQRLFLDAGDDSSTYRGPLPNVKLGAVERSTGRGDWEKRALFSKSLGDISITEVILNGRTCL